MVLEEYMLSILFSNLSTWLSPPKLLSTFLSSHISSSIRHLNFLGGVIVSEENHALFSKWYLGPYLLDAITTSDRLQMGLSD